MSAAPRGPDGKEPSQHYISAMVEPNLAEYGDGHLAVGYTKSAEEASARYELMLEVIRQPDTAVSVLDFGCGLAHLLDHIAAYPRWANVEYTGLDISPAYLAAARRRHPEATLMELDVLADDGSLPVYDYVVMNGLFNYRGELSRPRMLAYWKRLLHVAYRHARIGIAFNVMTKHVEWERDDLFHLPLDTMSTFVARNLSRHMVIRHDYAAYEYTTYVYRTPTSL